jgi:TRAP-type C4-dicarboxylate transport system permease small subunit
MATGADGRAGPARQPLLPPDPPAPWPIALLGRLVDWSVLVIGGVMATLVFANVIVHNVFNGDIAWTTEFCELLMVWVTFLGGAAATRRGAHMVINELINHLKGAKKRYAEAAIQIAVFVTLGLLTWYGVGIAQAGNFSTLTVLGWPMSTQYTALPVASVITMIFVAWDFSEILRGKSTEERHGKGAP